MIQGSAADKKLRPGFEKIIICTMVQYVTYILRPRKLECLRVSRHRQLLYFNLPHPWLHNYRLLLFR